MCALLPLFSSETVKSVLPCPYADVGWSIDPTAPHPVDTGITKYSVPVLYGIPLPDAFAVKSHVYPGAIVVGVVRLTKRHPVII